MLLLKTTATGCILLNISLFLVQYEILAFANSEFKRPDWTRLHLRVLKFSEFSRMACPPPPSISRLGLSLWALTCPYCTPPSPPQYIPPRLTNKKWLGTPLSVQCRFVLLLVLNFAGFYFLRFQQANMKKKALNSRFKHFELFRLSLEKLDLYRDNKMSIIRNFMDFL